MPEKWAQLDSSHAEALESFLIERIESSVLLLHNLRAEGLTYNGKPFSGDWVGLFKNNKLTGCAAHFRNGMILLETGKATQALLTTLLNASGRPVSGLLGTEQAVGELHKLLTDDVSLLQLNSQSTIYTLPLSNLIMPGHVSDNEFVIRLLEEQDLPEFTQWMADYAIETLRARRGNEVITRAQERSQEMLERNNTWILETDGQIVSTCTLNAITPEALSIASVWTPQKFRCRSYARSVMAAALFNHWSRRIPLATLFLDDRNMAAHRTCESLGFKPYAATRLVIFRQPLEFATA